MAKAPTPPTPATPVPTPGVPPGPAPTMPTGAVPTPNPPIAVPTPGTPLTAPLPPRGVPGFEPKSLPEEDDERDDVEEEKLCKADPALRTIKTAAAELERLRKENADLKASTKYPSVTAADQARLVLPRPPVTPGMTRAKVTMTGTHVGSVIVEVPNDAPNRTVAAIEAAKAKLGVWSFGVGPTVEFLQD
jgi:hypothetical protein